MPKVKQPITQLGQYRQTFTSPEHRQAITVGRQLIVEDTLEQLAASKNKQSKHHFLFIGPRGIGKSHLLSLIEDGISRDASLKESYVVARFPEESHRTLSFADFLLGLCDLLQEILPEEPEWHTLYENYSLEGKEHYENYLDDIEQMIECWDLHRDGNLEAFASKLSQMSEALTYKTWSETKIFFLQEQLAHLKNTDEGVRVRLRLSSLLSDLARWKPAGELLRDALLEVGENQSLKAAILNDLAVLLQDTNRIEEAEPLMRQALSILLSFKRSTGYTHPNYSAIYENFRGILEQLNHSETKIAAELAAFPEAS